MPESPKPLIPLSISYRGLVPENRTDEVAARLADVFAVLGGLPVEETTELSISFVTGKSGGNDRVDRYPHIPRGDIRHGDMVVGEWNIHREPITDRREYADKLAQVGSILSQKRRNAGITQSDLATLTGLSQALIAKFETGRSPFSTAKSLESLFRVIDELGINPEEIGPHIGLTKIEK